MIVRARFRDTDPVPSEMASAEARLLALAYAVVVAVEDGRFRSVADVARALEVTRARLSQVIRRRWAAAEAQGRVLGQSH